MVELASTTKLADQTSSSGRDIRTILQNRKKCANTNEMTKPSHQTICHTATETALPTIRTPMSDADNRKPG